MKEGSVLLSALPQVDGSLKDRPVLLLKHMPPFGDFLVCGISSQIEQASELDETISSNDSDFRTSGLKTNSLIRLGYLAVLPRTQFKGRIGAVSSARLQRLQTTLADFLRPRQ